MGSLRPTFPGRSSFSATPLGGVAGARQLTIDAVDPMAKIPEFKVAAVRLEPLAKAAAA